ncbi:hypothetical protein V6Z12_D02G081400 [Gossypium hirsutum]
MSQTNNKQTKGQNGLTTNEQRNYSKNCNKREKKKRKNGKMEIFVFSFWGYIKPNTKVVRGEKKITNIVSKSSKEKQKKKTVSKGDLNFFSSIFFLLFFKISLLYFLFAKEKIKRGKEKGFTFVGAPMKPFFSTGRIGVEWTEA